MICDKWRKNTANLPISLGDEAVVSSSLEYDIYKKEDFKGFKIEQIHIVPSLIKTLQSPEVSLLSTKKVSHV
jgi:hypothetical protein